MQPVVMLLLVAAATALMFRFAESFPFANRDDDDHEKDSPDSSNIADPDEFIDG